MRIVANGGLSTSRDFTAIRLDNAEYGMRNSKGGLTILIYGTKKGMIFEQEDAS
jgi:hypothetical protein